MAYFIIPIFALANADVETGSSEPLDTTLILNVVLCLVFCNSNGITSIILLTKKLGVIQVPIAITNRHIVSVSFLAGIGFSMAIFIASLAFSNQPLYITCAKIGVLIGSLISTVIDYIVLRWIPRKAVILNDNVEN